MSCSRVGVGSLTINATFSFVIASSLYVGISISLHEDVKMGKMNIVVDDKLEDQFRKTVFQRKGMKKGNISDAIEEAIVNWIG